MSDVHPHPDKRHVMTIYRRHILGRKRKWGTARGLVHYRSYVRTYLECKREVLKAKQQ
jgi:hypothetical protein